MQESMQKSALSVESWPGVLQMIHKHIRGWKFGLEAEMGFLASETCSLPTNAKSLVGSVMANLCGSYYPVHMAKVEASGQRVLVDKAFLVPKCVRNVAPLSQVVTEDTRSGAWRSQIGLV